MKYISRFLIKLDKFMHDYFDNERIVNLDIKTKYKNF